MSFFKRDPKVLIVEDELDIAESLKARLSLEGYVVTMAHDGKAAVEQARAQKPDLILLDVMLPLINGYDVCKILKTSDDTRKIPVLVLTALPHLEDAEKAFAAGADDFLNKPYSNDRLMQKVHKFIPAKNS